MIYRLIDPEMFPRELIGFVDPTDFYSYRGIIGDDGKLLPYKNFDELVHHIEQRREALRLPKLPSLRQMIENYLYRMKVVDASMFERDRSAAARTVWRDINTGVNLALSLSKDSRSGLPVIGGGGWVSRGEANRRASICRDCPENVELEKSLMVRARNKLASLFTIHRQTDYDEELLDCGVCGCPNEQKVHYSDAVIAEVTDVAASEFPVAFFGVKDPNQKYECWVRKILDKKVNDGRSD